MGVREKRERGACALPSGMRLAVASIRGWVQQPNAQCSRASLHVVPLTYAIPPSSSAVAGCEAPPAVDAADAILGGLGCVAV